MPSHLRILIRGNEEETEIMTKKTSPEVLTFDQLHSVESGFSEKGESQIVGILIQ